MNVSITQAACVSGYELSKAGDKPMTHGSSKIDKTTNDDERIAVRF
jgi:hypothetical protein